MSEGKFEVLSLGTIDELRELRRFANRMIILNSIEDMPVPHEMRSLIDQLEIWYKGHKEKYPL